MANFVFNIAKGRHGHLATLPGTNDALVAVPLETSGLESDAALKDKDTLADVLAGATNEQTTMGRKVLTFVTSAVDDAADTWIVDAADFSWVAASGNTVSKIVVCYDPDTTGGTDADLIPLYAYDVSITPAGDVNVTVNASGLAVAS